MKFGTGIGSRAGAARGMFVCTLIMTGLAMLQPASAQSNLKCWSPRLPNNHQVSLPAVQGAVENNKVVRIIAIGSSSTSGTGASSSKKSYLARFESRLRKTFPDTRIEVINAGVSGQLARHMLARMKRDVLSKKPTLVIWQTGVNDALRRVPLRAFEKTLESGMERLMSAKTDVILVDQQYMPRIKRRPDFYNYLRILRRVARNHHVTVVKRFEIMQKMASSSPTAIRELLAPDMLHMSDLAHRCVGDTIAQKFEMAIVAPQPPGSGTRPAVSRN